MGCMDGCIALRAGRKPSLQGSRWFTLARSQRDKASRWRAIRALAPVIVAPVCWNRGDRQSGISQRKSGSIVLVSLTSPTHYLH